MKVVYFEIRKRTHNNLELDILKKLRKGTSHKLANPIFSLILQRSK